MTRGGSYLAKQRTKLPAHLIKIAIGTPRLFPRVQRYRIMDGNKILGQFSNMHLVDEAVAGKPGAVVFDVSMCPSRVIYRDGNWTLGMVQ